jgi:phosphoserine phosphatase
MKKDIAVCLDLDGTLTKEEIFPILALELGIYEEMKLLT